MVKIKASDLPAVCGGVLIQDGNTPWGAPGQVASGWSWWNQAWFDQNIRGTSPMGVRPTSAPA